MTTFAPETETVERSKGVRRAELALGTFLALLGFAPLVVGLVQWIVAVPDRAAYKVQAGELLWWLAIGSLGVVGVVRSRVRTERRLTAAGEAAKAAADAEAAKRQAEFFNRWYVRYPAAVALLCVIWWLLRGEFLREHSPNWLVWVYCAGGIGFALWWTREVSQWVLGVGLLIWAYDAAQHSLERMSIPTAIIIGACIIAYAVYASRRR